MNMSLYLIHESKTLLRFLNISRTFIKILNRVLAHTLLYSLLHNKCPLSLPLKIGSSSFSHSSSSPVFSKRRFYMFKAYLFFSLLLFTTFPVSYKFVLLRKARCTSQIILFSICDLLRSLQPFK